MAERVIVRGHWGAVALLVLLALIAFVQVGEAILLTIPSSGTKCVSEVIQSNGVLFASYCIFDDDYAYFHNSTISAQVTSPKGNNLHKNENVTHGRFAFTTTEAGNYVACFWINGQHMDGEGLMIALDWKVGVAAEIRIAAEDWDHVVATAKKEKLIEIELGKLEGQVEAIHNSLIPLKMREAQMTEISEITYGRVAWFSIMTLGVCIVVSVFQLWYLRRYFQKKKLI
ncbi:hypothetical protein CDL15_Pgr006486 [Punica granatum]|uniref:GOLD domain-containing protein n=1 Tax=Punica granatum TaxID=22663 RepID=A0A218XYG3_PUNGR|nr:hypothetical protein CDL15_Pgr006486 [Punica granatum]PKI77662.1 hypothetical protein CRG98_001945 [Punica granatum]